MPEDPLTGARARREALEQEMQRIDRITREHGVWYGNATTNTTTHAPQPDIDEDFPVEMMGEVPGVDGPFAKSCVKKKKRKTLRWNGHEIHQPTYGVKPNDLGWKRFLKKLLAGRPLKRHSSVKKAAGEIAAINGRNSTMALIKMIKSHGTKFDYVVELTKEYRKLYGRKELSRHNEIRLGNRGINIVTDF